MIRLVLATAFAMCVLVPMASAEAQMPKRGAAVLEGDVFVLTQGGDTKRVAGRRVWLIRSTFADDVRLKCAVRDSLNQVKNLPVEVWPREMARWVSELEQAMARDSVATVETGLDAHYRFDGVPPGDYLLWSRTYLGTQSLRWLVPVTVKPGATVKRDLNHNNARETSYPDPFCSFIDR